ncbi:hypothetical protein F441_04670 [Phytophthora nicotianae CJ01A1]|uniref:Uncharacterized protein n=3 Tax=Phytophthora nicotianae TaxID=4792 RepID=W2ZR43_PHYNI|nr:hypothetical protein L915_04562 [Phytophthora nicotianae]ETP21918.1 hypothetical protein F441_04670 [Phytophthora nicotianae CJ01A1]ETP49817.1 hypothetical protein F442_04737 [Phytophthora nicotianae P10297]ETL45382.1 hypothetical protein L916_04518 [Phytophthora nicotianae]ETL98561.1 hypothetical protein L917_04397 [Phytophthora nicotianae]
MELLETIQRDVLKQMEVEAVNLFSRVEDFRDFIIFTRPMADVGVTLKLCCILTKRLKGINGTRVILVDAMKRVVTGETSYPEKQKFVQVIVCDDKMKSAPGRNENMVFRVDSLYVIQHVEFVGINDGVAKGSVQFEIGDHDKNREIGPPVKRQKLSAEGSPQSATRKSLLFPCAIENDVEMATANKPVTMRSKRHQ